MYEFTLKLEISYYILQLYVRTSYFLPYSLMPPVSKTKHVAVDII
jgi:hypothetical protein